jgi:hypothetical protein
MDMGTPVEINSVLVSADGSFDFLDANGASLRPIEANLERGYARAKGPKILSRLPIAVGGRISSNPDVALLYYDTIFALDTNTRIAGEQGISVTAAILGKWNRAIPNEPKLRFAPVHALEFRNVDCHPDLLALKHHIVHMQNDLRRANAGKIAFIVDSHLGDLPRINSREMPILDDCYLPEWADLIYASDSAQDSLANLLLRAADRAATALLKHIENGKIQEVSGLAAPEHSSFLRVWRPRN